MVAGPVLLHTGPLGLVTNPNPREDGVACNRWLRRLSNSGVRVIIPEIADYELRRELLRAGRTSGLRNLDALVGEFPYLPLTTAAMRQAAAFWADARNERRQTAHDLALDGDVILAVQAVTLQAPGVIIATTNVGHLRRYAPAEVWHDV
jgi:predicted nucleic acid-binding protein